MRNPTLNDGVESENAWDGIWETSVNKAKRET